MYLVALWRNSSNVVVGCMHKLSENGPGFSAVTMWCIATSGLRFRMSNAVLLNLFMKALKVSDFSCRIFTKAIEVRWCGRLVVNCAPNLVASVSKQSMDWAGSRVNQLKAAPLSEVGNIRHHNASSAVCKPTCVRYAFTCSSGSVDPSYLSNVGLFQVPDKGTSRMVSVKGLLRGVVPNALFEVGLMFSWYELPTSCVSAFAWSPEGILSTASGISGFSASLSFIRAFSFLKTSISFYIFKINVIGSGWLISSCTFLSLPVMFLVVTMWTIRGVFSSRPTMGAKMFLQDLNPVEHFLLWGSSRLSGLSISLLSVGSPLVWTR